MPGLPVGETAVGMFGRAITLAVTPGMASRGRITNYTVTGSAATVHAKRLRSCGPLHGLTRVGCVWFDR
jgi:hypothetical protein